MTSCEVCGRSDDTKPMCFRGEKWCCDLHRKIIIGELSNSNKLLEIKTENKYPLV